MLRKLPAFTALSLGLIVAAAVCSAGAKESSAKPAKSAAKPGKTAKPEKKPEARAEPPPGYNLHVRPILAQNCFRCHGADEKARKAGLRLDVREEALKEGAIVPGDAAGSGIMKRLLSSDPEEVMPPPDSHLSVTGVQRDVLRRWIEAGAVYEGHWAFQPPVKTRVPLAGRNGDWERGEIDRFILDSLQARGLKPARKADRERWIRRVTMDLTGIPPSLKELDDFLADVSPDAYQRVTDRLLASPRFGERMAVEWLDAARYADTYGRHEDADCDVWPWRDWVIRAFNDNLPWDKFLTWQLAGDMIPEPTRDTVLATAFNRLHQQSNESGSNEEEFRCEHVADRVKTVSTAMLGLTMECARCHDHKYDPVTQRDYYAMSAFLNNIDELGLFSRFTNAVPSPAMFLYEGKQEAEHRALQEQMVAAEKEREALRPAAAARFKAWLAAGNQPQAATPQDHLAFEGKLKAGDLANSARPGKPGFIRSKPEVTEGKVGQALHIKGDVKMNLGGAGQFRRSDPFSLALWIRPGEAQRRAVVIHRTVGSVDAANRGYELILDEMRPDFCITHFWPGNGARIRARRPLPVGEWSHVCVTWDGSSRAVGMRILVNGEAVPTETLGDSLTCDITYDEASGDLDPRKVADAGISAEVNVELAGRRNDSGLRNGDIDEVMIFDRELSAAEALKLSGGSPAQPDAWLACYLRETDEAWRAASERLRALREKENAFVGKVRQMMVMRESGGDRRRTFVLARGQFDQPSAEVQPDMPSAIFPFSPVLPRNRLGLAQWMTDPRNPLTSRVAVNRLWQVFFGRGLVATPEDFGIQGDHPSHPDLLDWLACDFMENGWDVKRLCRMIVLSAAYRQSSVPSDPKTLADDPDNAWLARGPRHRWPAEMLRDQALTVSGLLVEQRGGPSVFPYQPAGLWEESGTQHEYTQDHGANLYRRSLYTFWRRTMPPPGMTAFDAPTREYCRVRREHTATPLQALVLLNDPQYIEAARVLGENLVRRLRGDASACCLEAFRILTGRIPDKKELALLVELWAAQEARFKAAPEDAEALRRNGESPADDALPAATVGAAALVIRTLFNHAEAAWKM